VAEALFGIPDDLAQAGLCRLPDEMKQVIRKTYELAGNGGAAGR